MEIKVDRIAKVLRNSNGDWEITKEDGWTLLLESKYGIVPEVAQEIKILHHWGNQIHGIQINGVNAFWKSKEEANKDHENWKKKVRAENAKAHKKLMKKIKNEQPFCTIDISGMGGGYEHCCQKMLRAGMKYLQNKPNFVWDYIEYKNIYGICWSDSIHAKKLDEVITKVVNGCTGAMHQAVIAHLRYIHQNSYDKWLEEMGKERQYVYPKELPAPTF